MPQVNVTIAGKAYRMACGEGEESHLEGLAALYDGKIAEMRTAFGEIGDMRLHVMAALTFADETAEMKKRLDRLESEIATLQGEAEARSAATEGAQGQMATALDAAAQRVEAMMRRLK
jgi:cell division protein ZapA